MPESEIVKNENARVKLREWNGESEMWRNRVNLNS